MPNTPQSNFEVFLRDIEPSRTTKSRASQGHIALREFLAKHKGFKDVHDNTFLSGSYKRDTAIRPQKNGEDVDRPDVDIVVVTNHTLVDSPKAVVDLLFETLSEEYDDIRRQQRSVGISTSKVDMDAVPIIAPYGAYGKLYIPDRKLEAWLETNPPQHSQWTTDRNKQAGGRFKPLVKLLKWWRRQNSTVSKRPKGFVIECFAAECMSDTEKHYGELFVGTLESLVSRYAGSISRKVVPWITDPGVATNSVTAGMTFSAFEGFYNKAKAHAEKGRQALEEKDVKKATDLWREILGQRFPKVEGVSMGAGLLTQASAASSLTFPNRPLRPNKPAGFA